MIYVLIDKNTANQNNVSYEYSGPIGLSWSMKYENNILKFYHPLANHNTLLIGYCVLIGSAMILAEKLRKLVLNNNHSL